MKRTLLTLLFAVSLICYPDLARSEMSSADYLIYADSINSGSGYGDGGEYVLESTLGETPSDYTTTGIYEIRAGYQYMTRGSLSLSISASSLNLGELSTASVSSASTVLTVSTDSATGYSLSVSAVSGSSINAVGDGAVTAGSEEYGFSASGSESQVSGDVAVAASTLLAATSSPISDSIITMTFKASINDSSTAGSYNQAVTVVASANL